MTDDEKLNAAIERTRAKLRAEEEAYAREVEQYTPKGDEEAQAAEAKSDWISVAASLSAAIAQFNADGTPAGIHVAAATAHNPSKADAVIKTTISFSAAPKSIDAGVRLSFWVYRNGRTRYFVNDPNDENPRRTGETWTKLLNVAFFEAALSDLLRGAS